MTTRSRPRSAGRAAGFELASWYLVRLTGLALFVLALAHFAITQFLYDPASETAAWIVRERWASLTWRTIDWLMLVLVLIHGILGVRTVVHDHVDGRLRTAVMAGLYLLGLCLGVFGTTVILALPFPVR